MKYVSPEMEIVRFDNESVIVASGAETETTKFDDVIGSDELP